MGDQGTRLAQMKSDLERNLGKQPIAAVLANLELKPTDLVNASTEQITHKMIARACKGRRLTANVQGKLLRALERATRRAFKLDDLFNY